jgi:hypothetical protein
LQYPGEARGNIPILTHFMSGSLLLLQGNNLFIKNKNMVK